MDDAIPQALALICHGSTLHERGNTSLASLDGYFYPQFWGGEWELSQTVNRSSSLKSMLRNLVRLCTVQCLGAESADRLLHLLVDPGCYHQVFGSSTGTPEQCTRMYQNESLVPMHFAQGFAISQVLVPVRCFEEQRIWQGILLVCRLNFEFVDISLYTGKIKSVSP